MLLVETHLTSKYSFQIRGYTFYRTDQPDGKAHCRTGILIRNRIKHHVHQMFATNYLQATSIKVQSGNINHSKAAVYWSPRFTISEGQFMYFFNLLGDRFIALGDYNAKHTHWNSSLVAPKERQLHNAIIKPSNKLDYVFSGSPTYWPTDPRKVPDLIDFAVTKNIPRNIISAKALSDLSSNHSPRVITLLQSPKTSDHPHRLTPHRTNWLKYEKYVSSLVKLTPQFNIEADIDCSTEVLKDVLVEAATISILQGRDVQTKQTSKQQRLKEATRTLNRALKHEAGNAQQRYIKKLSPTSTKHSL